MPPGDRSPRAEHSARTRRAVIDAALELFATQGYDNTTTGQIADRAGISIRTYFRHFPSKEAVLLHGETKFIQSVIGVYLSQPDDLADLDAICKAMVTLSPAVTRLRRRIKLYNRAIASSPTLRGRERFSHDENVAALATAVARRRGLPTTDDECEFVAAIAMLMMERAIARWAKGPARTSLADLFDVEFKRLEKLLG